jgi:hypothetical protein
MVLWMTPGDPVDATAASPSMLGQAVVFEKGDATIGGT